MNMMMPEVLSPPQRHAQELCSLTSTTPWMEDFHKRLTSQGLVLQYLILQPSILSASRPTATRLSSTQQQQRKTQEHRPKKYFTAWLMNGMKAKVHGEWKHIAALCCKKRTAAKGWLRQIESPELAQQVVN